MAQKDPVCLMDVEEDTEFKAEYKGKTYYFCAKFCLDKFKEKPQDYLVRHRDLLDKRDC